MNRTTLALACITATFAPACANEMQGSLDDVDPNTLSWVAPSAGSVEAGDVVEFVASTRNPSARIVHFSLDGREIGSCDATDPTQDCHVGSLWRWSNTMPSQTGDLSVRMWFDTNSGAVEVTHMVRVVPSGMSPVFVIDDEADDPGDEVETNTAPPEDATLETAWLALHRSGTAGFDDPNRRWHRVFRGRYWRVENNRVFIGTGSPTGSTSSVSHCMQRYGRSIRRWADHFHMSRASVVATALTESNCTNPAGSSDGLSAGPMQVTGSTCGALMGMRSGTCRARMHSDPDFSFQVGVKYMASSYQRHQHDHDPPRIAAAYNAGSIRPSSSNRWHMLTTGNHIDRFVAAYNAYHRWEASRSGAITIVEPERSFGGTHVTSIDQLPPNATEGDTVFVGDWSERDGTFYEYVRGAWRSTAE